MSGSFRDQPPETKAACRVAEDANDEVWVYCSACQRAMRQGDCVVGDDDVLRCGCEDCPSKGNLAFQSLYGWDAYRSTHGRDTAHWPQEPVPDERYMPPGASP
jgi:hypothetical protein